MSLFLDLAINLFLIGLFVTKLGKLLMVVHRARGVEDDATKTQKMLEVMAKITVLAIIGILSTNAFLIAGVFVCHHIIGISKTTYVVAYIIRDIGVVIDVIVVFLSLPKNKILYKRMCNVLHSTTRKTIEFGIIKILKAKLDIEPTDLTKSESESHCIVDSDTADKFSVNVSNSRDQSNESASNNTNTETIVTLETVQSDDLNIQTYQN